MTGSRVFKSCVPVSFGALIAALALYYSHENGSSDFFQAVGFVIAVAVAGICLQLKVETDFISDASRDAGNGYAMSDAYCFFIHTLCFGLLFSQLVFDKFVIFLALPLAYFLGQGVARLAFEGGWRRKD